MLVSYADNFEGILEAYDILIRYLYYKKRKDYNKKTLHDHGDITHIKIPSLELITHLAIQRNILINTWERFKYSQWNVVLQKNETTGVYIFMPKDEAEYKEHIIASNRRQYSLMLNLFQTNSTEVVNQSSDVISKIADEIDKK